MQAPAITRPGNNAPALPLIPFSRAARQITQPANVDTTTNLSTSGTLLGPFDVPAVGFLRSLVIQVTVTGFTGTAAVYKEDGPWSALSEIFLADVNGAPIVGPVSGYDLFLINKWGGYAGYGDPSLSPNYSAPTSGNFSFTLRIPLELGSRDGVGSLANMNASSTYKLRLTSGILADVFSTNPAGGTGAMRVKVTTEAWSQPAPTGFGGAPQQTEPPALGTTQYWSKQVVSAAAAYQTIQLRRVGNLIRNLIVVGRNVSGGARSSTDLPADLVWTYDNGVLYSESRTYRQHLMRERIPGTVGPDTGVLVYDFTSEFDGLVGGELRNWLPTIQSTRLEFAGTFGAAQNVTILTNDVAPVGNPFV